MLVSLHIYQTEWKFKSHKYLAFCVLEWLSSNFLLTDFPDLFSLRIIINLIAGYYYDVWANLKFLAFMSKLIFTRMSVLIILIVMIHGLLQRSVGGRFMLYKNQSIRRCCPVLKRHLSVFIKALVNIILTLLWCWSVWSNYFNC